MLLFVIPTVRLIRRGTGLDKTQHSANKQRDDRQHENDLDHGARNRNHGATAITINPTSTASNTSTAVPPGRFNPIGV
jgi:hypothetical protein